MRHCPSCDSQLPDDQETCLHCGGPLDDVAEAPSAAGDLVLLTSVDAFESRRLLDRLADAGLSFSVVSDEAAQRLFRGRSRGNAGVNVLVPAAQYAAAREIQQAVLRESLPDLPEGFEPPPDGAETCPACATPLAADAAACGECGLEFLDADA